MPNDNPTIGLLLCKGKDKMVAEYALKDVNKPMGVSEYKLFNHVSEELHNPDFNRVQFEAVKIAAVLNRFVMTPTK